MVKSKISGSACSLPSSAFPQQPFGFCNLRIELKVVNKKEKKKFYKMARTPVLKSW
jgi:hypothetical protein